jgi:hypothetical protein
MNDDTCLEKNLLPIRPVQIGKQLTIKVNLEDTQMKEAVDVEVEALVDSGCMQTCIDETFARASGLTLIRIPKPIRVEYVDGTSVKGSTIHYAVNLRICSMGATVVTGALATWLKSAKLFLGFDWLQVVNPSIDWVNLCVQADEGIVPMKMRSIVGITNYKKMSSESFPWMLFRNFLQEGSGIIR